MKMKELKEGMFVKLKGEGWAGVRSGLKESMILEPDIVAKAMKLVFYSSSFLRLKDGKFETKHVDLMTAVFEPASADEIAEFEHLYLQLKRPQLRALTSSGLKYYTGSDPEIFITDEHGTVMPAYSFLKDKEVAKHEIVNGIPGAPYWDGFQAEWNIHANSCHAYVVDSIQAGIMEVLKRARIVNKKASLSGASVLPIPEAVLSTAKHEHVTFGCAPSMNVYGPQEPLTIDPRDLTIRFAGFHIHYGFKTVASYYPVPTFDDAICVRMVKTIDKMLGPVMTSLLQGMEDPRRRAFYGRAGEYRLPVHGLEYRVPSSTVMSHPILTHMVLDVARWATHLVWLGFEDLWEMPHGDAQAQHILNDYNIEEAHAILKLNEDILDTMLYKLWDHPYISAGRMKQSSALLPKVKAMIFEGAKNHLNVTDLEANWHIGKAVNNWKAHSENPMSCVGHLMPLPEGAQVVNE